MRSGHGRLSLCSTLPSPLARLRPGDWFSHANGWFNSCFRLQPPGYHQVRAQAVATHVTPQGLAPATHLPAFPVHSLLGQYTPSYFIVNSWVTTPREPSLTAGSWLEPLLWVFQLLPCIARIWSSAWMSAPAGQGSGLFTSSFNMPRLRSVCRLAADRRGSERNCLSWGGSGLISTIPVAVPSDRSKAGSPVPEGLPQRLRCHCPELSSEVGPEWGGDGAGEEAEEQNVEDPRNGESRLRAVLLGGGGGKKSTGSLRTGETGRQWECVCVGAGGEVVEDGECLAGFGGQRVCRS